MSNNKQLFQPDDKHLAALKLDATNYYEMNVQCDTQGKEVQGSIAKFEIDTLYKALELYAELKSQGYTLMDESIFLPVIQVGPVFDWVTLYLRKPAKTIKSELEIIHAKVENDYIARFEAQHQVAVATEVESRLAAQKAEAATALAEQQAIDDAAEYARIEAEVLKSLGGE